jgi:nicotinate-nucleotide adenylyltransferase
VKIALFGGSFDPPHLAHQLACLLLLEGEGFEQVWLLPTCRHAFGKPLSPFEHRAAMCALTARPFGGRVVVCEVERDLVGAVPNRTFDTLTRLEAQAPEAEFAIVVGSDLLPELPHWWRYDELRSRAVFLVLPRPGHPVGADAPRAAAFDLPDLSSTELRRRAVAGESLRGLVPGSVADYIAAHGLYAPGAMPAGEGG